MPLYGIPLAKQVALIPGYGVTPIYVPDLLGSSGTFYQMRKTTEDVAEFLPIIYPEKVKAEGSSNKDRSSRARRTCGASVY